MRYTIKLSARCDEFIIKPRRIVSVKCTSSCSRSALQYRSYAFVQYLSISCSLSHVETLTSPYLSHEYMILPHYILFKKLVSRISFLRALLMLFVNSVLACVDTTASSPGPVRSFDCSCNGIGFSSPAASFACFRSYFARDFLVIVATSTPPSRTAWEGALGSATSVHSHDGYSWSSSAMSGLDVFVGFV